jgi:beta-glucosidase
MKSSMRLVAGLCLLGAWGAGTASAQYQYPFQNPDLPAEERVRNLVSLLTTDEKIVCLGTDPSVPRLGIHGTRHVEGLHGLALGGPGGWGRPTPIPTTQFAQAIGMGETWDPDLVRKAGALEGYETRYIYQSEKTHRGGLVVRAPNVDLGRDPRWGRTEECFGEDAFFNGTMVVAMVKGLQGDDPKYWLTASLMKHFLANSNEDGRGETSSNFDERLLREYYSVPFRMGVIDGGSRAYMAAYNAINGIPATANPILRSITVKEWGQDGIICTDAGALGGMVFAHKYYPDLAHAAAGAVKAGINQFLDRIFGNAVRDALQQNLLTEPEIDAVLENEFRVMIKLGMLDPPERVAYTKIKGDEDAWKLDGHKAVAKQVALESVVLLKNEGGLLPLDRNALKSIAVIGPRANDVALDWYSGTPPYTITPLDGIKAIAGAVKVSYAANNDDDAAANAARQSDVAIVFVGNHPTCDAPWAHCPAPSDGKEAMDRKWIDLEQEALVKQVYAANPKTVVVLVSSFPFAINWTQRNVPAILHITHNGQEEGSAIAEALFGEYNPGGRLVQTFPRSLDQVPAKMDYDIRHGRTYMYFQGDPLYPFGYGLSYSTFRYSNLKTSAAALRAGGEIIVSVDVTNTGTRAGDEVVQLYVKHLNSGVERPLKELKGFRRVTLAPGQTRTVTLPLKAQTLAFWDMARQQWEVEADKVRLMVGSSSADIRVDKTFAVAR